MLNLDQAKPQWAFVAILTTGSFLFAYLYTWYPAYYRFGFAKLRATLMWCLAWASVALVCVQIANNESSNSGPILFYVGLPLAALAGALAISERRRHILGKDVFLISSPYEIELKVRFMLEPLVNKRRRATAGLDQNDKDAKTEEDIADSKLVAQAGDVYRKALMTIGNSSILLVFQSQYFYATAHNGVLGARALAKASRAAPFHLDEQFFVYRRQQMCQEYFSSNASESRDVIMYMTLMQSIQTVRQVEVKCMRAQAGFWNELLSSRPDSTRLRAISSIINENIALGQKSFRTLLRMSPDSPQVCRMYANWLGTVMYDQEKKVKYLNRAAVLESGVEDAEGQDGGAGALSMFRGAGRLDIDGMRDGSSAVLRLLCDEERLGTVETVNAAALRLFGCARHDLIGRDFTVVLPEPFARAYQSAAQAYVVQGSLDIRGSKSVFFKNKNGYLFPGRLTVKDIPGQGVLPSFVAIAEPVTTGARDHFLLVNSDGYITGCTVNCLALCPELRVEDALDNNTHISALVPGYDETLAQKMATLSGASISLVSSANRDTDYGGLDATVWETAMSTGYSDVRVVRILTNEESGSQPPSHPTYDQVYPTFPKKGNNDSLCDSFEGARVRGVSPALPGNEPFGTYPRPGGGIASFVPMAPKMERASSVRFPGRSSMRGSVSLTLPEGTALESHEMKPLSKPSNSPEAIAIVLDEIEIPHVLPSADSTSDSDDGNGGSYMQPMPPLERIATCKVNAAYEDTTAGDNVNGYSSQTRQHEQPEDRGNDLHRKKRDDLEDGRSSASGRSNSSVKRVNTLRRLLVETNNKGLSPVLRTFRMVVLFSLATLIAMAIAQYVVEKKQVTSFKDSFDILKTVGDIRFNGISAGLNARFLSLANSGLKPASQIPLYNDNLFVDSEG
eukprot:Opistho-2@91960